MWRDVKASNAHFRRMRCTHSLLSGCQSGKPVRDHTFVDPCRKSRVEEMKCENIEGKKCLKVNSKKVFFFCTSASAWRFRMWLTSIDSGSLSSAHTAECFTVSVSVVRLILNHQRVLWPLSPPRLCGTSCSDSGHSESSFSLTVFLLEAVITRISVSVCVCQRKEKLWF